MCFSTWGQPDPSDCGCNCSASSPDRSGGSSKNEKHDCDHDRTDFSPEGEVIYGSDSSAHKDSDSGTHPDSTSGFHVNYFALQSFRSQAFRPKTMSLMAQFIECGRIPNAGTIEFAYPRLDTGRGRPHPVPRECRPRGAAGMDFEWRRHPARCQRLRRHLLATPVTFTEHAPLRQRCVAFPPRYDGYSRTSVHVDGAVTLVTHDMEIRLPSGPCCRCGQPGHGVFEVVGVVLDELTSAIHAG